MKTSHPTSTKCVAGLTCAWPGLSWCFILVCGLSSITSPLIILISKQWILALLWFCAYGRYICFIWLSDRIKVYQRTHFTLFGVLHLFCRWSVKSFLSKLRVLKTYHLLHRKVPTLTGTNLVKTGSKFSGYNRFLM